MKKSSNFAYLKVGYLMLWIDQTSIVFDRTILILKYYGEDFCLVNYTAKRTTKETKEPGHIKSPIHLFPLCESAKLPANCRLASALGFARPPKAG